MEEAAGGDAIFVVITLIPRKYLPSQTTCTLAGVPAQGHGIEDTLSKREPLRGPFRRIGKFSFSSSHDCEGPESLIVIAFRQSLVGDHVIFCRAHLMEKALHQDVVVRGIIRQVPIVNKTTEHGTGFPPIVSAVRTG